MRGLAGHPLFKLLHSAWQEYELDYARYFASAMVYYVLISLVPLLLLVLGALGLVLRRSELAAASERQFLEAVGASFGAPLRATLGRLLQGLQQGSVRIALVVSLIGLLLSGSKMFHHLRMTFRAIWRHESPLAGPARRALRATLVQKATSFVMVLATIALLLVALLLIVALSGWPGAVPF